jgi:RNA polymerase sigma-70 factor (ECF subfamily)
MRAPTTRRAAWRPGGRRRPEGSQRGAGSLVRLTYLTAAVVTNGLRPDTDQVMQDRLAFEALFRKHAGVVRGYAARRAGGDEADDIVADVFLVAWRRLDELPDDPLPWLLGVARRVIANRRRGTARQSALHDRLRAEPALAPDAAMVAVSDGAVAAALAALGEHDRELLLLTAWEGLGNPEAARVLGVQTGTLRVRLHRARRRFARLLGEVDGGDRSMAGSSEPMEAMR